jgi:Na+/melibiose symporter-like transporter
VVIGLCFFADGMLLGSWAARVPAVQDHAGLTNPQLGVALFASALGALIAMPIAGRLCDRSGSRIVLLFSLLATCTALLLTSFATDLVFLAAALFAFGAGFGSTNVAANAQGLALERMRGRRILSSLHAAFSAGGLAGAGLGGLAAAVKIGPQTHFAIVCLVLAATTVAVRPRLLAEERAATRSRPTMQIRRALLLLGAAAFCCMLAEGAAADWSAVYLSRSADAGAAVAALGYTAFSLAMTASRLAGDRISERLESPALVGAGGALAAAGLGGALALGTTAAGIVGFVAMGAGLGVVIPVLFRTAGTAAGVSPGVGVATASTIGWLGFLAGPGVIGFVAGLVGLRTALAIVVAMMALLAVLARGIRPMATSSPSQARAGRHIVAPHS